MTLARRYALSLKILCQHLLAPFSRDNGGLEFMLSAGLISLLVAIMQHYYDPTFEIPPFMHAIYPSSNAFTSSGKPNDAVEIISWYISQCNAMRPPIPNAIYPITPTPAPSPHPLLHHPHCPLHPPPLSSVVPAPYFAQAPSTHP
jgi:hypothetical protein